MLVTYRPPPARRAVAVCALAALLVVGAATADPPTVASKRAEAQRVLSQIQTVDAQLGRAVEAYNAATTRLNTIERDLERNRFALKVARANLRRAQVALARRLVEMYTSAEEQTDVAILLGASSLDDFLDRLETVDSVSKQDDRVLGEVTSFRTAVIRHQRELVRAHAAQRKLVAQRASQKERIESQLAQRRRLLSWVRGEIARLQAQERARQLAIAGQVRARLQDAPSPGASGAVIGAAAEAGGTTVAPPSRYGGVVGIAMRYLGTPYKWGGSSPSEGFDCSGFIMYVYAQVGVSLPHNAAAQYGHGSPVSKDQLQPGDLVFFNGLGHNGLYIGNNQFIHAPHTGDVVKISSITGWYSERWDGARRL